MELRAKRSLEWENIAPQNHADAEFLLADRAWRFWVRFCNLLDGRFWFCVFTWMYEKCSDFGRSFTRPLFLLIALNILTFGICLCMAVHAEKNQEMSVFSVLSEDMPDKADNVTISAFRAASEYSIYKTGNFLDFSDADKHTEIINQRLFGSSIEPAGMRIYGFFKGLFSAILIFLTGLGVRNKYRVG